MHVQVSLVSYFAVFVNCLKFASDINNCDQVFTETQVVIEARNKSASLHCQYKLEGPKCPRFFNLHFVTFNLSYSIGCTKDSLEIFENEVLCGKVSGVKTYFANSGQLTLRLTTKSNDTNLKILITKLPCYRSDVGAIGTFHQPSTDPLPLCCSNNYASRNFFLSGTNLHSNCVYKIRKFSARTCRLRIHFVFFSLGEHLSDGICNNGFIELDGKLICGCRTGLKLISAFDSMSSVKTIRVEYSQIVSNGFILEVTQDECPERTSSIFEKPSGNSPGHQTSIHKARLVNEQKQVNYLYPDFVKHVYVFEDSQEHERKEETTYINTLDYEMRPPNAYTLRECEILGRTILRKLSIEKNWKEITRCNSISNPLTLQCTRTNFIRGYIQSPQYPYYYGNGLRICFRFEPQNGYCGIRLFFLDFDIVKSTDCQKDYLLLGNNVRYCGRSLHNTRLTFDLRSRTEEIVFVTNGYTCGRGFKALYEQLPCRNIEFPTSPPHPLTTTAPPIISDVFCNRNIQDNEFVMEVYTYNRPTCIFNIFKSNDNVCRLSLKALSFNLLCEYEYLIIDNKIYCGNLDSDTINIQFNRYQLSITYVRASATPDLSSLRFRITGSQLTEECDLINIPEVQIERISFRNAISAEKEDDHVDICGILLNATDDTAKELCDFIQKQDNSTTCIPVTASEMYISYESFEEFQLNLEKMMSVEKIYVQEVPCNQWLGKILLGP